MKIGLTVSYQGSAFYGWQSQPDLTTIQGVLESALSQIANEPIQVICAGRTDRGVHALGQFVHFECPQTRPMTAWVRGTNCHLPDSVRVISAEPVDAAFHARFSALSRRYQYLIYRSQTRLTYLDAFQLCVRDKLCVKRMQTAAQALVGCHDFSAFRGANCQAKSPIRTIQHLQVLALPGDRWVVDIQANAFLLHMVRNIVGCLLVIGAGEKPVDWLQYVLESRDRQQAGMCISPRGLHFVAVEYPEDYVSINARMNQLAEQFMAHMGIVAPPS